MNPSTLPFPFEPIRNLNLIQIFGEYVIFYILAYIASELTVTIYDSLFPNTQKSPFKNIDINQSTSSLFSYFQVLQAGPIEEMSFRGLGYALAATFALPILPMLFLADGVWAGYHTRNLETFAYVIVIGLYLTKFWYFGFAGLWWMAIVMHMFHNTVAYGLSYAFNVKNKGVRGRNSKGTGR